MHSAQVTILKAGLAAVIHTFAEKQKAERPRRWESLDCKMKGTLKGGDRCCIVEIYWPPLIFHYYLRRQFTLQSLILYSGALPDLQETQLTGRFR